MAWQQFVAATPQPRMAALIPQRRQDDENGLMNYIGKVLECIVWTIVSLKYRD